MNKIIFAIALSIGLITVADAQSRCRTLTHPDGRITTICCDSRGNCSYY